MVGSNGPGAGGDGTEGIVNGQRKRWEEEQEALAMLPLGVADGEDFDDMEEEEEEEYTEEVRRRNMRRNLNNYLGLVFTRGFGVGSWTGTPNAALLQHICGGRVWGLGVASGAMGMSQLIFALPLGYLGDKNRSIRARMLSVAGVVQIAAITLLLCTVTGKAMDQPGSLLPLWLITSGLAGLGYVIATMQSLGQSLLADSLVTQQREGAYTRVQIYRTCGLSLGPFLALLIFRHYGNTWSVESIRAAVTIGIATLVPSSFFLCSMNDNIELSTNARRRRGRSSSSSSLDASSVPRDNSDGSIGGGDAPPSNKSACAGGENEEVEEEETLFDDTEAIGHGHVRVNGDGTVVDKGAGQSERSPLLGRHRHHASLNMPPSSPPSSSSQRPVFGPESVPLLLFLSDLVISMSSGMTLRCVFIPRSVCCPRSQSAIGNLNSKKNK